MNDWEFIPAGSSQSLPGWHHPDTGAYLRIIEEITSDDYVLYAYPDGSDLHREQELAKTTTLPDIASPAFLYMDQFNPVTDHNPPQKPSRK